MGLDDADTTRLDELIGERHHCDAVALEDLFGQVPTLLRHFHRIMSQEITREQDVTLLLGNMRAEQRFAVFLLNLSAPQHAGQRTPAPEPEKADAVERHRRQRGAVRRMRQVDARRVRTGPR